MVKFALWALSLLRDVVILAFLFSPIIAFAVSGAVGVANLVGIVGKDLQVVLATLGVIGIVIMFLSARWHQAAEKEYESAKLKEKRQAEEERQRVERRNEELRLLVWQQIKAREKRRADQEQAARAEAKRKAHKAAQLDAERKRQAARQAQKMEEEEIWKIWLGTGGLKTGSNWIRRTWPNEAKDFTPWLARNLELVSACTELDLRLEGREVSAAGGWADIVARDNRSKSKVVIENQLDEADFPHWRQLVFYGGILDARIRIWVAESFSPNICRIVREQNRLSESRPGGAIYYLLKLRFDIKRPISLALGPTKTQRSFAVGD